MGWYNEEERDAHKDFNNRGRYGYDVERYNDYSDEANVAYTRAFDKERQEYDRYQERRAEEILEEVQERNRSYKTEFEQEESEPFYLPNNNVNYNNSTDDLPF